jgi:hypothetical protein
VVLDDYTKSWNDILFVHRSGVSKESFPTYYKVDEEAGNVSHINLLSSSSLTQRDVRDLVTVSRSA